MRALLLLAALGLLMGLAGADPKTVDLSPYVTANIQQTLYPTFPTGRVVPPENKFGVPFDLLPASGNNYVIIKGENNNNPLTIPIGVAGVVKVYMLMQALGPWRSRQLCTVQFTGSGGAHQMVPLWSGQNVRDFFEASFARTINNTTTKEAFNFIGQGGAFTDNTADGPRGYYHFDEQEFILNNDFAGQTLASITIKANTEGVGVPVLLGLTVVIR